MKLLEQCSLTVLALLAAAGTTTAAPAWPKATTSTQPNHLSTGCLMKLIGTPCYHYTVAEHAPRGSYTTIMDPTDGYIKYATLDSRGRFIPGPHIVGQVTPSDEDIPMHIEESLDVIEEKALENDYCTWKLDNNGMSGQNPPTGTWNNLVIFFQFSDHSDRAINVDKIQSDTFEDDHLSVQDFFHDMSNGKLKFKSTFLQPVLISKSESYCANGQSGTSNVLHECLREAIDKVVDDKGKPVDLSLYNGITFLHSGYGAEFGGRDEYHTYYNDRIWSHSWEVTTPNNTTIPYALASSFFGKENGRYQRIGVPIHEIAGMMGIPTMYGPYPGHGLGYYDPMASPYGFDGTSHHPGALSAYTKILMEWADVTVIDQDGDYSIDAKSNQVFRIQRGFPADEYFLIEARQSDGYDKNMRGPGLAIYHVDETANDKVGYPGGNNNNYPKDHYRVSLIQADGRFDLEMADDHGDNGDLFEIDRVNGIGPKGPLFHDGRAAGRIYPNTNSYAGGVVKETGIIIKNISGPGETMTFRVEFQSAPQDS